MSRYFDFVPTPLKGLYRIDRKLVVDDRGFFGRIFCAEEFKALGFNAQIIQMNHSRTDRKGAVRGLHFQYPPQTETKIVSCLRGKILDIAVDIREKSPTFLQWHAEVLSSDNKSSLYIPDGFAHGFQTLCQHCELIYLHTSKYRHESEGTLNVLDPRLAIDWPLEITELSERDRNTSLLDPLFKGINIS